MFRAGSHHGVVLATPLLVCFLILAQPGARGQEARDSGAHPDSALAEMIAQLDGAPLSLADAVAEALARATDVGSAEARLAAARATVRREKGTFDPEIFADALHGSHDQPTASFFSGADVLQTDETQATAGARVTLPVGTELSASLNTVKLETNSEYATLSPQYNTLGKLEIVQPLLKGFGPSTRGELTAAERELEAAEAQYQDAVFAVWADVEATYWELFANERDFAVQQLIRDRAIAFLKDTELRAKAGLVGPNEVANARVFLAEQEQVVLDREESLDRISDRLATLVGRRPGGGQWRFRSTDQPPHDFPTAPQDLLVQLALQRNYELRSAEHRVEALRARVKSASWDALPTLDLFGMLGGYGLAGKGRDIIFQFDPEAEPDTLRNDLDTGVGKSISQAINRDFPTWQVGLRFILPLGNRAAGGERDRLRAEVLLAQQQMIATQRALEERVRAQHRELTRGRRRLEDG